MKPLVYGLLALLAVGLLMALQVVLGTYMASRWPDKLGPLTNRGALFIIVSIIALFLAAFFYFRATFPH